MQGRTGHPVTHYALTMLAAGIGIPILAALNAALGRFLGSPTSAALILFSVAFCVSAIAVAITGAHPLSKVASAPKHLFLAGALIAFYVLSITHVAPHFGVGNTVFFVLIGQLISAAAIDHFGLFGAHPQPLNAIRAGGLALMAAGAWVTQLA